MNIFMWILIGLINGFGIFAVPPLLGIPHGVVIFVLLPLDIILMVMFSFYFNFRDGMAPEEIKGNTHKSRVDALNASKGELTAMGFEKTDEFYIKMIPDAVVFFFEHRELPVYLCLYHMGQKVIFDLVSIFNEEVSLTTAITPEAGNLPLAPYSMLQIANNASYRSAFDFHKDALDFLEQKGYQAKRLSREDFRKAFMKSIKEMGERVKNYSFWPVRLLVWVVTVRGNAYVKPVSKQFEEGMIKTR